MRKNDESRSGTSDDGTEFSRRTFLNRTGVAATAGLVAVPDELVGAGGGTAGVAGDPLTRERFPDLTGSPPRPENDPFYDPPTTDELAAMDPGSIVRYRDVSAAAYYVLPVPAEAWHVMYRTTDTQGDAVAAVTTVLVPVTAPDRDRDLLSFHPAYDALTLQCAPSYTLVDGTEKEYAALEPALKQGWVLSVPDYEGIESQYTAGLNTGRTLLDGVRATQTFEPAGLHRETQVGMLGYSGGGLASTWGAELQPAYAPELDLVGVAAGGVPPHLGNVARKIDGGPFVGIYFAAVAGLRRAYPEIDEEAIFNEAGLRMLEDVDEMCVGGFMTGAEDPVSNYAYDEMSQYVNVDDFLGHPDIQPVIQENRLGRRTPESPMYIYQGTEDELIPIEDVDALVETYRSSGVSVTYDRQPNDHLGTTATGMPGALSFLVARYRSIR